MSGVWRFYTRNGDKADCKVCDADSLNNAIIDDEDDNVEFDDDDNI